jgi:hypothetical protein
MVKVFHYRTIATAHVQRGKSYTWQSTFTYFWRGDGEPHKVLISAHQIDVVIIQDSLWMNILFVCVQPIVQTIFQAWNNGARRIFSS